MSVVLRYWSLVDMSEGCCWCDPSSVGTLTCINSLEYVCWARFATACHHGIISSYCIQKWVLRILTQRKATTKRTTLSHPLTRLNRKSCPKIPSTSDSHKSPILIRNLEFKHLLKSIGSPLPFGYFEFPPFSLGIGLKPQISQVSSFCP
jgi:hypothetical protein